MKTRTYLRSAAGTFFTSGDPTQGHGQALPTVSVRKDSEQVTTVGVHVKGNLKIQTGKVSNSVSVMLDPTSLRRKMAIEQMRSELQGTSNSTTIKR